MDDDIDIEEHDVLENPLIKKMFPDLSIIKKEITSYYEDELIKSSNNSTELVIKQEKNIQIEPRENLHHDVTKNQIVDIPSPMIIYKNKRDIKQDNVPYEGIIQKKRTFDNSPLTIKNKQSEGKIVIQDNIPFENNVTKKRKLTDDSSPTLRNKYSKGDIEYKLCKEPIKENRLEKTKTQDFTANIKGSTLLNNKIILGSKPNNPTGVNYSEKKKLAYIGSLTDKKYYQPKLLLHDAKSYLNHCNRFCKSCSILFPNKSSCNDHEKKFHSVNKNKSLLEHKQASDAHVNQKYNREVEYVKRNAKSVKNLKQIKSQPDYNKDVHDDQPNNAENICFHCNMRFETQQLLIDHLYNILQSKKHTCDICVKKFSDERKLSEHMLSHHKSDVTVKNMKRTRENCSVSNEESKYGFRSRVKRNETAQEDSLLENAQIKLSDIHNNKVESDITHNQACDIDDDEYLYRCPICFYYAQTIDAGTTHINMRHGATKKYKVIKCLTFDPKCKFCPSKCSYRKSYNVHLQRFHNEYFMKWVTCPSVEKSSDTINSFYTKNNHSQSPKHLDRSSNQKEINESDKETAQAIKELGTLALKSKIFKCSKCDIHFLSAKIAMNHMDHIEILINWKCSICLKIFKKNDEGLHMKQHTFSESLTVYDISETTLSKVFYNCLKCAVHFNEDDFLFHYPICGIETPNSKYCKICDILIDKQSIESHMNHHKDLKMQANDFIIIEADVLVISYNSNERNNPEPLRENGDLNITTKANMLSNTRKEKLNKKTEENEKIELYQSISKTITPDTTATNPPKKNKSNKSSMKSRKLKQNKVIKKSYNSSVSTQNKNKLDKMTYCTVCKCHIAKKYSPKHLVHKPDRCGLDVRYVCKVCGLVLTNKSINSHRDLHEKIPGLKMQDFTFYDMDTEKIICPPIPIYPNCNICKVHFVTRHAVKFHLCSENDYLTCQICEIKLTETAFKLHMFYHYYSIDKVTKENSKTISNEVQENKSRTNSPNTIGVTKQDYESQHDMVFLCKQCDEAIDEYDKVVEHCQGHYRRLENNVATETCHICNLNIDSTCVKIHEKRHKDLRVEVLKVFKFDTYYFSFDNNIWYKHLFGSLCQDILNKVIKNSKYKIEKRIKFETIQDGLPEYTVYKCDKCRNIVEPASVYHHVHNMSCYNIKKYPCSTCGLPFTSVNARFDHKKIHESANVAVKSFRIVIFNRSVNNKYNEGIYSTTKYNLYQCRNCNGVVDKSITHMCNNSILKKCSFCGLLLYHDDHYCHVTKHREYESFIPANMKIILFGDITDKSNTSKKESQSSSFKGVVCDYKFNQCSKCKLCGIYENDLVDHICLFSNLSPHCKYCHLRIVDIHKHQIEHEVDPDFIRENMTIIECHPVKSIQETENLNFKNTVNVAENSNTTSGIHEKYESNDQNEGANKPLEIPTNVEHRVVTVYKCPCGLHFLDEVTLLSHLENICSSKVRFSKQVCSKCDLLFTPKILFDHLLEHHGNKGYVYKFDVREVQGNNDLNPLYFKCGKCKYHFNAYKDARCHFNNCNGVEEGIECNICNLEFHCTSHSTHKHKDGKKDDFKTIDIIGDPDSVSQQSTSTNIKDVISESKTLIQVSKEVSKENEPQMDDN